MVGELLKLAITKLPDLNTWEGVATLVVIFFGLNALAVIKNIDRVVAAHKYWGEWRSRVRQQKCQHRLLPPSVGQLQEAREFPPTICVKCGLTMPTEVAAWNYTAQIKEFYEDKGIFD